MKEKPKLYWTIIRILAFIIVGLMNTVLIKPEDAGTWKNYVGFAFLAVAIFDIILLIMKYFKRDKTKAE